MEGKGSSWGMKKEAWIHLFLCLFTSGWDLCSNRHCLLFCGFELIKEYNGIILCSCHLGSEKNSHCFTSDWLFPGTEVLLNHTEIVCPVWCSIAVSGRIRRSDICSDSSHTDEKLAQVAFCTTDRQLKVLGFELVCWVFSNGAFWECFHYFWTAHC